MKPNTQSYFEIFRLILTRIVLGVGLLLLIVLGGASLGQISDWQVVIGRPKVQPVANSASAKSALITRDSKSLPLEETTTVPYTIAKPTTSSVKPASTVSKDPPKESAKQRNIASKNDQPSKKGPAKNLERINR